MPYNRRRRRSPDSWLDLLPPLFGLLVLGVFFVPGFRQMLGALLFLACVLAGLALLGLVIWAIWRHSRPGTPPPPAQVPVSGQARPPALVDWVAPVAAPAWSLDLLQELEWKRFEDVVAAYVKQLGLTARTTRIGADGGIDVLVYKTGQERPVMVIQCKAWDTYRVGVKPVRELYGVMASEGVKEGAFFTTGEFTPEAVEFARGKDLDLVDGAEFLARIRQLTPAAQQELLAFATAGDYMTPTCPSCGVKMVLRTAGRGRAEGRDFWGCPHYPRCRRTFQVAAAD